MTTEKSKVPDADLTYLGRESERLSDLIEEQTAILFAAQSIEVPVKSCSLIDALEQIEPASASDLATRLERSHQIIIQKLPKLIKLKLVERGADPNDGRRYLHTLTPKGREQVRKFRQISPKIAYVYREIEEEIGPVYSQIVAAIQNLQNNSIASRLESTPDL